MATMTDAYAGLLQGLMLPNSREAGHHHRHHQHSTGPVSVTLACESPSSSRGLQRSYSDESFVDLSIDNALLQKIERRRSSLPSRDQALCRSTPDTRHSESTSEAVKNRVKGWWANVKYGWHVMNPGTLIDINDLNGNEPVYLLGQVYHNRDNPSSFRNFFSDFSTRIWFTYRQDFAPIYSTGHQSDSGWGCMLRTGQMLLAQAFMLHLLGRQWRWNPRRDRAELGLAEEHGVHRKIISWFGDGADVSRAPFGIHSLIKAAGQIANKKAGDWFGPSTAANLLKRCMEDAGYTALSKEIFEQMAIYVAQDCTIYTEDVLQLCTSNPNIEWRSVILLVPVRLGGETINMNYVHPIKEILAHPNSNCIGIIGGKPKHSLYFIGFQGNKLVYLDPHYLQNNVDTRNNNFSVSSYHCTTARKMSFSKLDPSATIGFYCKTRRDFEEFAATIQEIASACSSQTRGGEYPVFMVSEGSAAVANHSHLLDSNEERVLKVHRHIITAHGTVRHESEEYVVL